MKPFSSFAFGFLAVCLAVVLFFQPEIRTVSAEFSREGYRQMRGDAPALLLSAVSATDTDTISSTAPVRARFTNGNTRIALAGTLSVSGANAVVLIKLYFRDTDGTYTFLGISDKITLTAGAQETVGGRYTCEDVYTIETAGANAFDVHLRSVSSGNVSIRAWCYGSETGIETPND